MKNTEIHDPTIEALVQAYTIAAAKHGQAADDPDPETSNQQAEVIEGVYHELRERGREAQLHLLKLLDHSNPDVRVWAAGHALEFAPEQGEPVLKELVGSGGWAAVTAELALQVWREGKLVFP